jgi:hypothetical protein
MFSIADRVLLLLSLCCDAVGRQWLAPTAGSMPAKPKECEAFSVGRKDESGMTARMSEWLQSLRE